MVQGIDKWPKYKVALGTPRILLDSRIIYLLYRDFFSLSDEWFDIEESANEHDGLLGHQYTVNAFIKQGHKIIKTGTLTNVIAVVIAVGKGRGKLNLGNGVNCPLGRGVNSMVAVSGVADAGRIIGKRSII